VKYVTIFAFQRLYVDIQTLSLFPPFSIYLYTLAPVCLHSLLHFVTFLLPCRPARCWLPVVTMVLI